MSNNENIATLTSPAVTDINGISMDKTCIIEYGDPLQSTSGATNCAETPDNLLKKANQPVNWFPILLGPLQISTMYHPKYNERLICGAPTPNNNEKNSTLTSPAVTDINGISMDKTCIIEYGDPFQSTSGATDCEETPDDLLEKANQPVNWFPIVPSPFKSTTMYFPNLAGTPISGTPAPNKNDE